MPGLDLEASDLGNIRRLSDGRPLARSVLPDGYLKVSNPARIVHSLVALAFFGPCPDGHEVDHIDRQRWNARADNLRYLPIFDNRSGVTQRGGTRTDWESITRSALGMPPRHRIACGSCGEPGHNVRSCARAVAA